MGIESPFNYIVIVNKRESGRWKCFERIPFSRDKLKYIMMFIYDKTMLNFRLIITAIE